MVSIKWPASNITLSNYHSNVAPWRKFWRRKIVAWILDLALSIGKPTSRSYLWSLKQETYTFALSIFYSEPGSFLSKVWYRRVTHATGLEQWDYSSTLPKSNETLNLALNNLCVFMASEGHHGWSAQGSILLKLGFPKGIKTRVGKRWMAMSE